MNPNAPKFATPKWYVEAGDPGTTLGKYAFDEDEVLEFCGTLLYGNNLFEVLLLEIKGVDSKTKIPWELESFTQSQVRFAWYVRIPSSDQEHGYREIRLKSKHELFGTILAELRKGVTHIEAHSPGAE